MGPVQIIATIGPVSDAPEKVRALTDAGAGVFRLNCSHATPKEISRLAELVRRNAPEAALLIDLQGPKLRTGTRALEFHEGRTQTLHRSDLGFDTESMGVHPGQRLLLGDGTVELRISGIDDEGSFVVETLRGGILRPRQGVHLPDTCFEVSPITAEDMDYVELAADIGAEWVALSYVHRAEDILLLREMLGVETRVIAKIERREALANLELIVDAADAVMAARGDLGVEIPFEEVPRAQQHIAERALRAGKVPICATEMLESMRTTNRPTRAEVADVSTAVAQGYGAVMLSAETAAGEHPIEAVTAMRRICDASSAEIGHKIYADSHPRDSAVSAAAAAMALRIGADAILALTYTGVSAEVLSACRPPVPVIAATPSPQVARRLRLHWGVRPVVVERPRDLRQAVETARQEAIRRGLLGESAALVITASRNDPGAPADTIWWQEGGVPADA